jgi:hypothetical protein
VRFLGCEVGSIDRLSVFAHRIYYKLLGAVQGDEGYAHAGKDALEVAVPWVELAPLGLAGLLRVESGQLGDLALRHAARHAQSRERLAQDLRFLDLLGDFLALLMAAPPARSACTGPVYDSAMAVKRSDRTATKRGSIKEGGRRVAHGPKRAAARRRPRTAGRSRTALLLLSQVHLSASEKKRVDEILADSD